MNSAVISGDSWLWGIVIVLILFICALVLIVIFSFSQDLNMVTDHYYEKDLDYEQHILAVTRTQRLADQPDISYVAIQKTLLLDFPADQMQPGLEGQLQLYRPADNDKDQFFPLYPSEDTMMVFDAGVLGSGLWRVKLSWENGTGTYFWEKAFLLP